LDSSSIDFVSNQGGSSPRLDPVAFHSCTAQLLMAREVDSVQIYSPGLQLNRKRYLSSQVERWALSSTVLLKVEANRGEMGEMGEA